MPRYGARIFYFLSQGLHGKVSSANHRAQVNSAHGLTEDTDKRIMSTIQIFSGAVNPLKRTCGEDMGYSTVLGSIDPFGGCPKHHEVCGASCPNVQ